MAVKTTILSLYDKLELKEATFRQQFFPNHFHDSYSIGILESGTEQLLFGEKTIVAHAHSIIVINPYEIHAHCFFDHDAWKYRIIYINEDAVRFIQKKCCTGAGGNLHFPSQVIDDEVLFRLILDFHIDLTADKARLLERIVYLLITQYAVPHPCARYAQYHSRMADAADYLRTNYNSRITIDELGGRYGMDKYKFIRTFKQQVGVTPVSYMLLHRLNQAKALIRQNMPMTGVALESGFYDQSHFTHYFKKYYGISPLQYKKGLSQQ